MKPHKPNVPLRALTSVALFAVGWGWGLPLVPPMLFLLGCAVVDAVCDTA